MLEISIRASSVASLVDCPLRGVSLALGLVKPLPSTPPACIGSAVHAGSAVYDQHALDGSPITPNEGAGVVVDYLRHPPEDVNWGDMAYREAERRALGVFTSYCSQIAPRFQYQSVELTLEPMVLDFSSEGVPVLMTLTGTLDRQYASYAGGDDLAPIAQDGQQYGIMDEKTGARALGLKAGRHKAQLGIYELLAENTTLIRPTLPALIGALQTSSDYAVGVQQVDHTREALLGDGEGQIGILTWIAKQFASGDVIGNPSSWLCSQKLCPLWDNCLFR